MFERWRKGKRVLKGGEERTKGDLGPSPVPWLSDSVWSAWNEGDGSAAQVKVPGKPISEAIPTRVTEDDRLRAGRATHRAEGPAIPPSGTLDEHVTLLESTPGLGYFSSVRWPVCCERLSTLISESGGVGINDLERDSGSLDQALLEAYLPPGASPRERFAREAEWLRTLAAMRAGKHGGDGIAFFQCRACGRVYGAYHHP